MEPIKSSLKRKQPQINKIARDMVFCRAEAKKYAICVSSKGLAVEQHECQKQFG